MQYYVTWGEYKLYKLIEIAPNKYNNFRLGYREHKEIKTNEYGCKYPVYDGTYDIVLNYNTSYHENGMLITNGLGKDFTIETGLTKKTIKELQEATKLLDDDLLNNIIDKLKGGKENE